jgi:hypothetical protein
MVLSYYFAYKQYRFDKMLRKTVFRLPRKVFLAYIHPAMESDKIFETSSQLPKCRLLSCGGAERG